MGPMRLMQKETVEKTADERNTQWSKSMVRAERAAELSVLAAQALWAEQDADDHLDECSLCNLRTDPSEGPCGTYEELLYNAAKLRQQWIEGQG